MFVRPIPQQSHDCLNSSITMSRLSNLFGSNGSNFDTAGDSFDGDALKYSAPKEPKAKLPATIRFRGQ